MAFQGDSIYWVEVEKVVPNPFQPRREFDENKLQELAESIRMYGVLQPLTVTRNEVQNVEHGTFYTEYELIAGERRLRASRLAGVAQVPVIIREGEQSEQEKLELAIIENLQREDLNAIDRALAFQQLAEQFEMNHAQVGRKVGRSREYVANSIRLLQLPEYIRTALQRGELGEGHARTLLMLTDRPQEQETIFREILLKKMSVREVERIVRKIATDKVRKPNKEDIDQHLIEIEKEFTETLGTRVQIQKTDFGGKLTIDYFSEDDLSALLVRVRAEAAGLNPNVVRPAPVVEEPATPVSPIINPYTRPDVPTKPVSPIEPVATQPHTPAPYVAPASQPLVEQSPIQEEKKSDADPSLLARLAAHTPLSFRMAEPVGPEVSHESEPVHQQYEVQQSPVLAPENEPAVMLHNLVSGTSEQDMPAAPEQPVEPEPEPEKEDDQDLYSMRNFTV